MGITGPIGSGKSYVSAKLRERGYSVYDSDSEAKRLVENSEDVRKAISKLLGEEAYDGQGAYQTKWVADRVFQNKTLLEGLNAIVHPAVFHDFLSWVSQQQEEGAKLVFFESALLPTVRREYVKNLDCVVGVHASQMCRMHRVMARDFAAREKILQRMANQPSDAAFAAVADYTLRNEDRMDIESQVESLLNKLLQKG